MKHFLGFVILSLAATILDLGQLPTVDAAGGISESNHDGLIIVMGLPKSGSKSFHDFFQCNNLKSAHYCCGDTEKTHFACGDDAMTCGECVHDNMLNGEMPFAGCGNDYQVFSQFDVETGDPFAWFLPQHFTLPLLHEAYPDSVWILNSRRDAQVWADNVLHWFSVTNRIFNSFGIHYYSKPKKIQYAPKTDLKENYLHKEMEKSLQLALDEKEHNRRRKELIIIYEKHLDHVRTFAQAHNHKLIEVSVDDVQAGEILSEQLPNMKPSCWEFDAESLDNDWKDFSLNL